MNDKKETQFASDEEYAKLIEKINHLHELGIGTNEILSLLKVNSKFIANLKASTGITKKIMAKRHEQIDDLARNALGKVKSSSSDSIITFANHMGYDNLVKTIPIKDCLSEIKGQKGLQTRWNYSKEAKSKLPELKINKEDWEELDKYINDESEQDIDYSIDGFIKSLEDDHGILQKVLDKLDDKELTIGCVIAQSYALEVQITPHNYKLELCTKDENVKTLQKNDEFSFTEIYLPAPTAMLVIHSKHEQARVHYNMDPIRNCSETEGNFIKVFKRYQTELSTEELRKFQSDAKGLINYRNKNKLSGSLLPLRTKDYQYYIIHGNKIFSQYYRSSVVSPHRMYVKNSVVEVASEDEAKKNNSDEE